MKEAPVANAIRPGFGSFSEQPSSAPE